MLRAIALSLSLFVGIGAVIPFATDYAEASAYKHNRGKKKLRKYKKYSKNWWRQYYRRQQRNKSLVAQRRAVRLRQIRLANALTNSPESAGRYQSSILKINQKSAFQTSMPALLPTGEAAPTGWKRGVTGSPSEMQFSVDDESGANIGSASIAVVGSAIENAGSGNKTLGGVATGSLRRTVIDRMMREEGWVVNDYQKEIGGKKVFVVVAQSPGAGGKIQSRIFYFTESGGQIYSVATSAPAAGVNSQRIERDSERVVTALGQRREASGTVQQAELKKEQ